MNTVIVIGRLTKDAAISTTKGGKAVARFTVASEKGRRIKYGDEPASSFIPVTLFGKDGVHEYLKKGIPVAVSGKIQTGSYRNKDGNTVYTWEVNANNLELLPEGNMTGSTTVILTGRLTDDSKASYTRDSNTCVTNFTVACDRHRKERDADFIPTTLYGKLGESLGRYLTKGKMVTVKGRLDTGSFKRSDGTTVYTWKVVSDEIFLLGDGKKKSEAAEAPEADDLESTGFIELPDEFDEDYFEEF